MQGRYGGGGGSGNVDYGRSRPMSYPPPTRYYNGTSSSPPHDYDASQYISSSSSGGRNGDYGSRQLGNRPETSAFYPEPRTANGSSNRGTAADADDDATYHLDHLATYTVSPNRGLSTPNDAIARLRHMAQTSGIWTKRVLMRVGARDLVVVEAGEPIERFPLRLVVDAACETAQVESYTNVVVVTVAGDDMSGMRRRIPASEMHLFHCLHKSGQDIVDDIMTAKAGKPLRKHGTTNKSQSIETQPIYARAEKVQSANSSKPAAKPQQLSVEAQLSEAEKKAIDLKVLDLCFGDIELFVARLQNAAKEQRQSTTNDETTAPSAKEFFDIFQKVKLSLILLARLKHEIRDPNASELVHTLFVPFRLVVDASREPLTNRPQLASQVISPLLTTDAIKLLNNCLSSQESELFQVLGPAWVTARNKWKDVIPRYQPQFAKGYAPPAVWLNDVLSDRVEDSSPDWLQSSQTSTTFTAPPGGDSASQLSESMNYSNYYNTDPRKEQARSEDIRKKLARDYTRRQELERKRAEQRERLHAGHTRDSSRDLSHGGSSVDTTSLQDVDRQQMEFQRQLRARNAKICTVIRQRDATESQQITLEANEVVEVLEDTKNWWKVSNYRGDVGYAPCNILQRI